MFYFFEVPNKLVKKEAFQESLYIEDQDFLIKIHQEEKKKKEETERGVVIIDLF